MAKGEYKKLVFEDEYLPQIKKCLNECDVSEYYQELLCKMTFKQVQCVTALIERSYHAGISQGWMECRGVF